MIKHKSTAQCGQPFSEHKRERTTHGSATNDHSISALLRLAASTKLIPLLLMPVFLLAGCTISYPVWLGDDGVAQMCETSGLHTFSHNGVSKEFLINLIPESSLLEVCGYGRNGAIAEACIFSSYQIYVTQGPGCPRRVAHELSHGFGLHFVDRPLVQVASTSL